MGRTGPCSQCKRNRGRKRRKPGDNRDLIANLFNPVPLPAREGLGVRLSATTNTLVTSSRKITSGQNVHPDKLEFAKQLRRKMTPAERRLWKALRRNALDGLHFRRQQVIEGYIADFYCDAAKLAIELDGAVHQEHCNMTNRAIMRSQASECRFSEFQMRRCSTLSQSLSISDRR